MSGQSIRVEEGCVRFPPVTRTLTARPVTIVWHVPVTNPRFDVESGLLHELGDANRVAALRLEHVHDDRLVWPLEIPRHPAPSGHRRELADRLRGIRVSGPGESRWVR